MQLANHAAGAGGTLDRAKRIGLFARASREELLAVLAPFGGALEASPVRGPETGLVMVRGRIGGGGNAFNLGETTVTRASVRLPGGAIGHAQRLGTDREATRLAAIADAVAEDGSHAAAIDHLVETIAARIEAERLGLIEETEATRVDFFTLVRGED